MDYSFVEAGGKVPGDTQTVPFDFRSRDEVFVLVDGVDVSSSFYSWINDGLISIGAGFPSGTKTRVERRTSIAGYESSQSGSSVYDWRGANANFDQNLFIIQEYADKEGARNAIVDGLVDNIEQVNELVDEASGYRDLCAAWANTPEDVDVPGQATGSRSSLHYSVKSYKFSLTAGDRAADALTYADQSKGYRDTTLGYSQTAQAYAVSMSLINGTDYSAKYWANQAYLAGGVPIGTIIDSYGNGATTPVGYLKVIPGLEITAAYPEFRAWAIANGWAVNGSGNPVFPSTDDALFKRQWRAGQTLRDAGRAFGTVQVDKMQGHVHAGGAAGAGVGITGGPTPFVAAQANTGGPITDGTNGTPRVGLETNPANITVTWFIKAYSAPLDTATVAAAQVLADLADARARLAKVGSIAILQHQQANNVAGGATVASAWTTRTLNTKVSDPDSIVTLASNVFTPTIDCELDGFFEFQSVNVVAVRLWNITDGIEVARSMSLYVNGTYSVSGPIPLQTRVIGGKSYRVEYFATASNSTNGMGIALNSGSAEVYATVKLRGIAK